MVRVLSHQNPDTTAKLAAEFPEIEFVDIPRDGMLDPGVRGDVLWTSAVGAPTLAEALTRGVRWVHTMGTGVDAFPLHLIGDGQTLTCSRGASAVPIAEWSITMMLAFEKQLPAPWLTAPPKAWFRVDSPRRLGTLSGRTLGIVGMGAIGERTAQLAIPFGMRVKALRRSLRPAETPGVEVVATLDEVVRGADHILIAAPLTSETRNLFDDRVFGLLQPGAHVVNIARGGLIDDDALRRALASGAVARASLDAVEPEPLPAGHWMYGHPSIRLSPHVSWLGGNQTEALIETFRVNLRRFLAGEPLDYVVDVALGY